MPLGRSSALKWTAITVRVLLVLFAGMFVYMAGHAALPGGANAQGPGGSQRKVCAPPPSPGNVKGNFLEDPQLLKAVKEPGAVDAFIPFPVEKGVEFYDRTTQLCKADSGLGVQLLYQSSHFATPLLLLAALFLLDRLISGVRRESGFNEVVVRKLWFLGVLLIAGTLATSLYTTFVETGLAVSMVAGTVRNVWKMALYGWAFPWEFLIAGLGLVVMSKVVRVGAHMREELEGTV